MADSRYIKKERIVSVRILLARVLRRWRMLVLFGLILAVLAGAYKAVRNHQTSSGQDLSRAQETYEKKMKEYENNRKTYQDMIDIMNDNLQSKRDYLSNSLLGKIDPTAEAVATTDLLFSSNDRVQVSNDLSIDNATATLIDTYNTFIFSQMSWEELANEMNTKARYLQELVTCNKDYNAKTLTITVKSAEKEDAQKILDYILQNVEAEKDRFDAEVGSHEVTYLRSDARTVVDDTMANWYSNKATQINDLESSVKQFREALNKLESPSAPVTLSTASAVKNVVKYAAAGFFGGIVLLIVLLMLLLLIRGKVLSADEMQQVYGLRSLAVLPQKKVKGLDRAVRRMASTGSSFDAETAGGIIGHMLREDDTGANIYLLNCGCSAQRLQEAEKITRAAAGERNVLVCDASDGGALDGAAHQDAVFLLAAEAEKTAYHNLDHILQILGRLDRQVLGGVVMQ